MIFHRLHHRLITAMAGLMVLFITAIGLTLYWSIRRNIEQALGEKCQAVAVALSAQYTPDEVQLMMQSMGPRLQDYFRQPVMRMLETADLKRIYFFTLDNRSLLDTDTTVFRGQTYYHLQFFPEEIERLKSGHPAYTPLFSGMDGNPAMSGFAPLMLNETVVGGIGVDGNVQFLNTIARFKHQILLFGCIATFASMVVAFLLARNLANPIAALSRVSRQIGIGNYDSSIPQTGTSEIRQLANTMESMRQDVVRRERELKAMMASVAHEIRNPLGGIELFTGLLSDEINPASTAMANLKKIQMEIKYLNNIVYRFLEYARPETPRPVRCHVSQLIREIRDSLTQELESSHCQFIFSEPEADINIPVDMTHFRQILLNLIQNSMHAALSEGQITLHVQTKNGECHLKIEDNGSGIPDDKQPFIFDPFFTTREKGTGLGLSIVKQLTEANHGQIRLVRSDLHGTEFELIFPMD